MLTLSQARSHSTKGFTQLLPPGPCSTSSPYRPVNIHLPLHLLREAFLDSPLNCTFCKKHLHRGQFSIISHTVSSPASAHELLRVCLCIPQIPRTGLDHLCKHRRGPPDPPAPDTTHRWPGWSVSSAPLPDSTALALLGCGAMPRGSAQSTLSEVQSRAASGCCPSTLPLPGTALSLHCQPSRLG